jgi:hypothetical protein
MQPEQENSNNQTVRVALALKKRGGRKTILPCDAVAIPTSGSSAFTKALAKAYRWRKQIEEGEYSSIRELSRAKGINESYACRILRLSLLAPEMVEKAFTGNGLPNAKIKEFWRDVPASWSTQPHFKLAHTPAERDVIDDPVRVVL